MPPHKPVLLFFSQQWAHPILHWLKDDLPTKFIKTETKPSLEALSRAMLI